MNLTLGLTGFRNHIVCEAFWAEKKGKIIVDLAPYYLTASLPYYLTT